MLTDAEIKTAIRKAGGKTVALTDPAPRGSGRLMLSIKNGAVPQWYAVRFVDGKRKLKKLGNYPAMSLTAAREAFKGAPAATAKPADATFGELVDAYLEWLEADRPDAHRKHAQVLVHAKAAIGTRPAASITPADIVALIRPVFDRGSRQQALKWRQYLAACFAWGLLSMYDYTRKAGRDWGLKSNPALAVPRDNPPKSTGERWLSEAEFRAVLADLTTRTASSARVFAILMLTGQRVQEIDRLTRAQWDREARVLRWAKTKNGTAHALPVCRQAAELLDAHDFVAVDDEAMRAVSRRLVKRLKVAHFTSRDMRRTWKTLAGQAGVTKADRDMLQNHGGADVSAKHYDRWENLPAKREAVLIWERWLDKRQGEQDAQHGAHEVVDRQKYGHRESVGLEAHG